MYELEKRGTLDMYIYDSVQCGLVVSCTFSLQFVYKFGLLVNAI